MDRSTFETAGPERAGTFQRLADAFAGYLRTRTADHWVMFVAGLVLGVLLG
jgi:hypothetical protein